MMTTLYNHAVTIGITILTAFVTIALEASSPVFEPAAKYALEIDGKPVSEARIYLSLDVGSSLLLTAPELSSPLLVRPRDQRLERIRPADLSASAGGKLTLAADVEPELAGSYAIEGTSLLWTMGERRLRLTERPLLGLHDAEAIAAWDPEYARRARRDVPAGDVLEALRRSPTTSPARIRVYFGTWCPLCGQAVPRWMRLATELEGSGLRFEFFGLPRLETDAPESFWAEAQAVGMFHDDVEIVPLAVVYRGDRRIGRITSGWSQPERELEKVLVRD